MYVPLSPDESEEDDTHPPTTRRRRMGGEFTAEGVPMEEVSFCVTTSAYTQFHTLLQ